MTFLDRMIKEFPHQFQGKENITVLVKALSRQLQEVEEMFQQLNEKRAVQNAVGKQLDGVGDIVVLSRAEAGLLAGERIDFAVIDDERYRKYLYFKIFKNNSQCTYLDFMRAFLMFWDKGKLHHSYDPEWPATIILATEDMPPEVDPYEFFTVPIVKADGVTLRREFRSRSEDAGETIYIDGVGFPGVSSTTLPPFAWDVSFEEFMQVGGAFGLVSQTTLPSMKEAK